MNTKHSSPSTPKQQAYLFYQQQQQQQQQLYDQQQTNQQQQLMNSRRAVFKLHKGIKQLQQPQPQHNHYINNDGNLQMGSVNWEIENSQVRFGTKGLLQSKCKSINQTKSLYGLQINPISATTTTSNQHHSLLLPTLFQPFYQYMKNIHHSYSIQITKLQKKITRLEKTLQKFIITKIKSQKQNNLKWFQKQYMYEKEIIELKRKLYDLQQRQQRLKLKVVKNNNKQQQSNKLNNLDQDKQQSQQQQRSLLEGIDDQLQWSNARLLQINKFINSSVYRQSEKSVSRFEEVMPVTVGLSGGENGLGIQKKKMGNNRDDYNVSGQKNSLNQKQYQHHQNNQQYRSSKVNNPTQYNHNTNTKQSNPQQIMIVDEQLLSQLSNSNQIQQQIQNKKSYNQPFNNQLTTKHLNLDKNRNYPLNDVNIIVVDEQNTNGKNNNQFQQQVQLDQQQEEEQDYILGKQESQVGEFNYIIGNSGGTNSSNYYSNNKVKHEVIKTKKDCDSRRFQYKNDNKNDNNNNNFNRINKNTKQIHTYNNSTKNLTQQQSHHIHHYHHYHQHIPSLINSEQLQQNYTFTYQQKYLLQQIKQLKQILQKQNYQQQQSGDKMLLLKEDTNRKQIKSIVKMDKNDQQKECQFVGGTQKKGRLNNNNGNNNNGNNNGNSNVIMRDMCDNNDCPNNKQTVKKKNKLSSISKPKTNNINQNQINNNNNHHTNQLSSLTRQLQTSKHRQNYLYSTLLQLKQSISEMRTELYSLLPCQYCGLRDSVMQVL